MSKSHKFILLIGFVVLSVWMQHQHLLRWLSYPLLLMSTVPHELGHGIAALLMGNEFTGLHMFADGSGYAQYRGHNSGLAEAFIAAAGLVGPALTAGLGFYMARETRTARMALVVAGWVCLGATVLVVRGLFANLFIASLGLVLLGLAALRNARLTQGALLFLCVQLSLSVFSRSDYLFMRSAGHGPSDVEQMARHLILPYWFWGLMCGLISLVVLLAGLSDLMTDSRDER